MERANTGLRLYRQKQPYHLKKAQRTLCFCCVVAVALSLAMLFLWPAARESAKLLCNLLFDASEQVNSYVYERFPVSDTASPISATVLLSICAVSVCIMAVVRKSRGAALLFMVSLAGAEIYFGLTPPALLNVALFVLPALLLLQGQNLITSAGCATAVFVMFFVVAAVFPGVDSRMEAASESVRDRLAPVEQLISEYTPVQQPDEAQKTRYENRLNEQSGRLDADNTQDYQDYRLEQEREQELSKPRRIQYLKIAILLVLIVLLLLTPFLPFVLLDSRRRKALERRAAFLSEDPSEAIRAMFLHMEAYLESSGFAPDNRLFSDCGVEIAERWSAAYANRYADAVALWQESAYSGHIMTQEQRETMRSILDETEHIIYDQADRKTKFRLKYMECLHA